MATIGPLTNPTAPVLTEAQKTILDRLRSINGSSGPGGKRTTADAAAAIAVNLPALQLAAGSAAATGDVHGAQYVARQSKKLADDLLSTLKNEVGTPSNGAVVAGTTNGPGTDQLTTTAKQLQVLLIKSQQALLNPLALQYTSATLRNSIAHDVQDSQKSVQALLAQLRGGSGGSGNAVKLTV